MRKTQKRLLASGFEPANCWLLSPVLSRFAPRQTDGWNLEPPSRPLARPTLIGSGCCRKQAGTKNPHSGHPTRPLLGCVSKSFTFLALISRTIWRTSRPTSKRSYKQFGCYLRRGSSYSSAIRIKITLPDWKRSAVISGRVISGTTDDTSNQTWCMTTGHFTKSCAAAAKP